MAAKFEKVQDPALGLFDGFDAKSFYQMVPVRGRREMGVVTDGAECILRSNNPSIARFANFRSKTSGFRTVEQTPHIVKLPANSGIAFSILGLAVGHTEVILETLGGDNLASLLVSVKSPVTKTFALCLLKDIRRESGFSASDVTKIMQRVSATYRQQANLNLNPLGPPSDVATVVVKKNLGNPLIPEKRSNLEAIVDETPAHLFGANMVIYGCWNIERLKGPQIVGLQMGSMCFVENDGRGAASNTNTFTFGHEVGHALGLEHHNGDVDRLMFKEVVGRKSLLSQFEIDTINPSGTLSP